MSRKLSPVLLAFITLLVAFGAASSRGEGQAPTIPVVVSPGAASAERLAAEDLVRTLRQLYPGEHFAVAERLPASGRAIAIGDVQADPALAARVRGKGELKPEGYIIGSAKEGPLEVGFIAGANPRAVAYGVYALLERLGCGYYLSTDTLPPPSQEAFSFGQWSAADAPVVPHRVVFDWHNFLSGCSTWSLPQWQKWIIQSQKMGYNAVMVHAYGNNPMVEFEFGGQRKPVGYLSTTRSGRDWSTMHVNDVRRLWGGEVFSAPVFGSEAAMVPDAQRVEAVQKMMHDAFQCAKDHAMGVYFAFDIETFQANPQNLIQILPERARFLVPSNSGADKLWLADPDTPEGYEYYKAQVAALLKAYPQITTLVCWFRWGGATPWMRMKAENMPPAWQAEYRAEIAKTPEMAKMDRIEGCFALSKAVKAYARALKELGRGDIAVATGTWDFGFQAPADRFMPKDVMFIGLDYAVLNGTSRIEDPEWQATLAAVGAHRPILPVLWAHHDDGAYLGRSFTPYENFAGKLATTKSAGYGIIHWTTRPLDLYFKSLIRQVWQASKDEPLRQTCEGMATRIFGAQATKRGGEYLYQWVTTAPIFSRETSDRFVDRKLGDPAEVAAGSAARLKILGGINLGALTPAGRDWVGYFQGLEQFIIDAHRNEAACLAAREALGKGDRDGARRLLAKCDPEAVASHYAKFSVLGGISTGEQGSVIAMNTRWVPHYESLRQALGMAPLRMKFGPTQHDPLAQSPGRYTFHFGARHDLWEVYGTEETQAEVFELPETTPIAAAPDTADAELFRSGIESAAPLTLTAKPIIQNARGGVMATLPAGKYALTLLAIDPSSTAAGQRVFELKIEPQASGRAAASSVLTFAPVKARFLRLACHGNNQNGWNSITEIKLDTLDKKGKITASATVKDCPAEAAADGDPKTRWAANGRDHWIQFPLDPTRETSRIAIDWFGGDKRVTQFEVLVSDDGKTWRQVGPQGQTQEPKGGAKTVTDRIDIFKATGGAGRPLVKTYDVELTRPGTFALTLTPAAGKATLCGVIVEPKK